MKRAPKIVPKKQMWRLFFNVFVPCIWVFVSVVTTQIVVGRIMVLMLGATTLSQPVWTAIYSAIVYLIAMVLIIGAPIALKRKVETKKKVRVLEEAKKMPEGQELRQDLGLAELPTWTDIGLAPVGFVVSLILAAGLVALFTLFPWFDAEQTQELGFSIYLSGMDRVVAFITLVILAPIAEEIIFRGWLYGKLRERLNDSTPGYTGKIVSILLTSLLFGLIHFQWNVGVNVFCLSVVLCVMREITGTIYAGILTHMIKNGVAFYLLYVLGIA